MNINQITFVHFINTHEQEKLIYLKEKDYRSNLLLFYSKIKPKLFHDNVFFTEKNSFSEVIQEVFINTKTNYFLYLKPEETIPFINPNDTFNEPYHYFRIKYNSHNDTYIKDEIRLYSKEKILSGGLGNTLKSNDLHKNIIINNYEYFYNKIQNKITNKDLSLLKTNQINSEILNYITDINLITYLKGNENYIGLEYIENFLEKYDSTNSNEYLNIKLNVVLKKIISKNYLEALNIISDLKVNFNDSIILKILEYKIKDIQEEYHEALNILDNIQKIKNNYYKLTITPESFLMYMILYEKGNLYKKIGNINQAIYNFEDCLNTCNNKNIINEIKDFIEKNKHKINELDFQCQSCGNCCKVKTINVTHNDIQRIKDNTNLKIDEFLRYIPKDNYNQHDLVNINNHKMILALKKKKEINECIFLENNLCSIYPYRPLACKVWPFKIRESDKELMWIFSEREFIDNYCNHSLKEGANNINDLAESIKEFKSDRSKFTEVVYNWNLESENYNNIEEYILKFSDKSILELSNKLKNRIINIFDENIVIEYKPFISEIFEKSINTFSFAIHTDKDLTEYLNTDFLNKIQTNLKAEFYNIYNIPSIFVVFNIFDESFKYNIELYFYKTQKNINISSESEIIKNNTKYIVETKNKNEMLNNEIDNLVYKFKEIKQNALNKKYNDFEHIYNLILNILFSLISLINKKSFELLKHNEYRVMTELFNSFLLSENYPVKDFAGLKNIIKNVEKIIYKLLEKNSLYN